MKGFVATSIQSSMSYQVLARKWRPRGFDRVVGQGHVLRALVNALDSDRLHHAYLFSGTRGVGKTSLARVFAKALNCEKGVSSTPCGECSSCVEVDEGRFVDLIEVDAASRTKVDETRDLLDNVQYAPTRGRYKVYLIDEVHMFSTHSFNALLKTLEEPPPHVKFLLATTDPKKLPVTILSRCLQFNLKRVSVEQLGEHLRTIADAEAVKADDASLALLAQAADGSVRDSLSLLDQAIAYGGGELRQPEVAAMLGTIGAADVARMVDALSRSDGPELITLAREFAESAPDYEHVLGEILSLLRRIAVVQTLGDGAEVLDESDDVMRFAAEMSAEDCQLFYQIGLIGRRDLSLAPDPQSGFEMVLLRMLAFRPVEPGAQRQAAPMPVAKSRPASGPARATQAAQAPKAAAKAAPKAAPKVAAKPAEAKAPDAKVPAAKAPAAEAPAAEAPVAKAPTAESPAASIAEVPAAVAAGEMADDAPTPQSHNMPPSGDAITAAPGELDWHDLVSRLKLHGFARELARNSALSAFNGNVVDLLVAPQHQNLKAGGAIASLEAALKEQLQVDVHLRLDTAPDDELDTPSKRLSEAERERQLEAEQNIDSDPTVRSLRDEFGATIEQVQPK
jgi:DNA polymerase-3 subunit gamma/tau